MSLLILLFMPVLDTSRVRGNQFRPLARFSFWVFVVNFFVLMFIGSQHVASPYVEIGAAATAFYFAWFLIIVPLIGIIENTLMDIALTEGSEVESASTIAVNKFPKNTPFSSRVSRKFSTSAKVNNKSSSTSASCFTSELEEEKNWNLTVKYTPKSYLNAKKSLIKAKSEYNPNNVKGTSSEFKERCISSS